MNRWGMLFLVVVLFVLAILAHMSIFGTNWVLLPLVIVLGVFIGLGFRTVHQEERHVVELFGHFSRILRPGLNWIARPFERVRVARSISEQMVDLRVEQTYTKDTVPLDVETTYYYRVLDNPDDILRSVYNVEQPLEDANTKHLNATFRNITGTRVFDEMQNKQDQVNRETKRQAQEATQNWGVEITRHNIREVIPPEEIRTALLQKITAEKQAAATVITAEAAAEAVRRAADAEKTRLEKEAEGMERLNKAMADPHAEKSLIFNLATDYITQLGNLAKSSTTTILPGDMAGFGAVGTMMQRLMESLQKKVA